MHIIQILNKTKWNHKYNFRVRERGHENYSDEKLDKVMKVAKDNSARAYAMV